MRKAISPPAVNGRVPGAQALSGAILPLLGIAVFINYIDRGNLATAAPLIKDELKLSGTQIGMLLSAFFWSYVPAQILAGWLIGVIGAYRTLALGLAVWSLATAASGFAGGFTSLLVLRLLLGLGESATFPCNSKLLAQHVSPEKLGLANGITFAGLGLGPACGTFFGGLLMAQYGWRAIFVLFGGVSLLWLAPWRAATGGARQAVPLAPGVLSPAFGAILRKRELWGTALGHFCGLYSFYFVISWLPLYLVKARGFPVPRMAEIGGLIYIVYAAATFLTGLVSDRLIASGASVNLVRKAGAVGGLAIIAVSLVVAAFGSVNVSVASLFCAGAAFGLGSANVFTIPQTLGGPLAAGKWVAVQNCCGNIGGIVAPIVTGLVIDRTGEFFWAFIAAAVMAGFGIIGWGLMIPRIAPINWAPRAGVVGK